MISCFIFRSSIFRSQKYNTMSCNTGIIILRGRAHAAAQRGHAEAVQVLHQYGHQGSAEDADTSGSSPQGSSDDAAVGEKSDGFGDQTDSD